MTEQKAFMKICIIAAALCIQFISAAALDSGQDAIVGIWNNEEKDARIEIFRCDNKYCGKIVWISKPVYSPDEDAAKAGMQRADDKNPNPELRGRRIIGLQIMSGFDYKGNQRWAGGRLYDPKTGKTYSGRMTLTSIDRLELKGYVVFSFFGRTSVWTRVQQ